MRILTHANRLVLRIALILIASISSANEPGPHIQSETLTGIYQLGVAETFDENPPRYTHSLVIDDRRYRLTGGDGYEKFSTGDTLSVEGSVSSNELIVGSMVSLDRENANLNNSLVGARNVALIFINFADLNLPPTAVDKATRAMFTANYYQIDNEGNPNSYSEANSKASFEIASYNNLTLNPDPNNDGEFDTYGPYIVPFDRASCNSYHAWANSADAQATLEGADLSIYQHKMYIVPTHSCGWNGYAIIGCGDNCRAWSRTQLEHTLSHELGHNLGLFHAASDVNGDSIISIDEDAKDLGVMMSSGSVITSGHLAHAPHRYALGWFQNQPDAITTVNQSGSYPLYDLDAETVVNPRALYMDLDLPVGRRQIFVSYRRGSFDQTGNVAEFFSPDLGIANTIRVHECIDSACRKTKKLATLTQGAVYIDQEIGNRAFGLRIEALETGSETAAVYILYGDSDNDDIDDIDDNCYAVYNPSQVDTDCDGYGNQCDADFNNDNIVNAVDLGILRLNFFSNNELTDLNLDNVVNAQDLGLFSQLFFLPPGPAGPLAECRQ